MDPNKNLEEQLALASQMQKDFESAAFNGIDQEDAYRLAQLVTAMHEWITKGGFLPSLWKPA